MKYKAIVFDWDGTLMDSISKIVESMQSTAKHLGLPVPNYDQAKDVIGISLLPALKQLFNIHDEKTAMELIHTYKKHFREHAQISSPLFNGAIELLVKLKLKLKLKQKGYISAVVTGKGRLGLEHNLHHSNTEHFLVLSELQMMR
nr:HAD hydrolase-like protein [uncultured Paraglaciecola sp.]